MDLLPVAAAGVAAALCAVVVRQRAPEIALALALAACVVLLWHTLPLLETIKDVLDELADLAQVSPQLLRPMLQTVGLALVTKLASALCKDAGEGSLEDLRRRPLYRELLDAGIFQAFVFLTRQGGKRHYQVWTGGEAP